jgi:GH15 family glucan-1,4-alpha-glucosidase
LLSNVSVSLNGDRCAAYGRMIVKRGDSNYVSLVYNEEGPAVLPSLGDAARKRIETTVRWWQAWAQTAKYDGPYRDIVVRSALALKLMAYAPSGALIAAPTTSLPEKLGGVRNWDYRYCWLRDASFIFRALFSLGYEDEAEAFVSWVLHATRLTWPELHVVYDVFGESKIPERELSHLEGYAGSSPVRVGNDAHGQLQLDVYGEVLDAAAQFAQRGGRFDSETVRFLEGLGHTICNQWRRPDEGIWEGRSGRFHHTHSKVLCWAGLDRLIEMQKKGQIEIPVQKFRAEREAIRSEIESLGYNSELRSYTQTFDGEDPDASLFTLPFYGFIDAKDPRMRSTCAYLHEQLGRGALIFRYLTTSGDGLPSGEGAFGVCSFWAVECLARSGDVDGAKHAFEELLNYANDLGLLSEEIDPDSGLLLGNFPQAFTHVGLINAAFSLQEYSKQVSPELPKDYVI